MRSTVCNHYVKTEALVFAFVFTLSKELAYDIHQTRGQQLKLDKIKLFIKTFLSSKPRKHFNLTRVLSCLGADLHMLLMCRLKFKLIIHVNS